jgi:3-isopropylmalate/(R)-2-methylmalate dehydratase small subunit
VVQKLGAGQSENGYQGHKPQKAEFDMTAKQFIPIIEGLIIKLGDHINTDLIYPGKYVPVVDPEEWPRHALEGIDPEFPRRIQPNDIIVAGRNFGCGSSRSQAVSCLKLAGIGAVVAVSFGRIFFRNSINQGFPVIQCSEAGQALGDADPIRINFKDGFIESNAHRFKFDPLPEFLMAIIRAGGLIPYTKELLGSRKI